MKKEKKFILGTANLGMQYGVTNRIEFEVSKSRNILNAAIGWGIDTFDTSPSYGHAEDLMGETTKKVPNIKVITKIPKMESYDFDNISTSLESSAKKIGQKKLYGILFHDPMAYQETKLNDLSKRIIETGITQNIGFSAYSEAEILRGKEKNPDWNLFQISENIADRRKYNSAELLSMSLTGDTFYVRSAFLQGLLLMKKEELDSKFNELKSFIGNLDEKAKANNVTAMDLCINYTLSIPWSSGTIIGVASESQLKSIINYNVCDLELENLPVVSSEVLDPRNW